MRLLLHGWLVAPLETSVDAHALPAESRSACNLSKAFWWITSCLNTGLPGRPSPAIAAP